MAGPELLDQLCRYRFHSGGLEGGCLEGSGLEGSGVEGSGLEGRGRAEDGDPFLV